MKWCMKWFGRLALLLTLVALLAGAVFSVQMVRSLPALDGQHTLPGLSSPVMVRRDGADVTHIEAASALDAWRAMGHVHAQERGWQLEFNRRLMRGQLSEILGPSTLDTDKLMRTLGLIQAARQQLQKMPPEVLAALQAYSEGVNAAHLSGQAAGSPEFRLLGVPAHHAQNPAWTPEDSMGWALAMALDLGGNWGQEFARLSASQVLDTERLWQLMPAYPGEAPATQVDIAGLYRQLGVHLRPSTQSAQAPGLPSDALAQWSDEQVRDMGILEGKGSNNWVLAGQRTQSGRPLLANDPHLALSAPAIWYFARLKAPAGQLPGGRAHPALDVIGATLPGLPFVVLGRTRGVAWGFTNTGPDVQDLYLEQLDAARPGQYRTPDGWADFELRQETIRVKGQGDVQLQVRSTRHGPVISDVQPQYRKVLDVQRYAVALRWIALQPENLTVLAGMNANWAQDIDQLQTAFADHLAPMQNVVMADTQGRAAFKAVGRVPLRGKDNDLKGMAPAPGWLAAYDWTGTIPYDETPAVSPSALAEKGWHASANQNILPEGYRHFMGQDWHTPERYTRITQMLAGDDKRSLQDMARMQNDVLSLGSQALLPHLLQARPQHPLGAQAMQRLASFDGRMDHDSVGGMLLNVWAHELTVQLLSPKLGEDRFWSLYGKRHFRQGLLGILQRQDAFWCGDKGCAAASSQALDRALNYLQQRLGPDMRHWRWADLHPAISGHRPFGRVAGLQRLFDVHTPSAGDLFSVNVGQYWANDRAEPFANRHAASMRAIYDLADLERSVFIYQTGQSGHAFSPRSQDMAQAWAHGQYRPMQLDPAQLVHALQLRP
jgi:penicillin amidase